MLARWLSRNNTCAVRRDLAGNVIARIACWDRADDERAPVVVMAHLDTVFETLTLPAARREGSRIVMPGIGDNGRGLAAILALADALTASDIGLLRRRPIELLATVGEEGAGNLRGARAYFDDRGACGEQTPAAVIAIDGPGDDLIVHHAIASRRLRVSFTCEGGHPWADADHANAIHVAGCAIASVAQLAGTQPSGVTVTVTRMGGGESLTSIPAQAWFDVDLRALDASAIPRLHDNVVRLSERALVEPGVARAATALTVSFDVLGDRPGGAMDVAHPLVQLAFDATRWQEREPRSASSSSDANIPLARGIPAITIGAGGSGGGAHTDHEWYDDDASDRGLARALAIIMESAKHDSDLAVG
jgi:tripeptide aminopeptidase